MRDQKHAVLLVSAELDEILCLADRIIVMYEGEITGEFHSTDIPEHEIGLYMAGSKRMSVAQVN
jgi:simple sugar transport system ATP-binding protein